MTRGTCKGSIGLLIVAAATLASGCGLISTKTVATFVAKEAGKKVYEELKEDYEEGQQEAAASHSDEYGP